MNKKRGKKNRGYAERLAQRQVEFGEGPIINRDGKRMPFPRPIGSLLFAWKES